MCAQHILNKALIYMLEFNNEIKAVVLFISIKVELFCNNKIKRYEYYKFKVESIVHFATIVCNITLKKTSHFKR